MTQQFILHVGHDCDPRLKTQTLYDWQTNFRKIEDPVIHIQAPPHLKTRKALYERLKRISSKPITSILYPMTCQDYIKSVEGIKADDLRLAQNTFASLQPPVQYLDCDQIELAEGSKSLFDAVIKDRTWHPELDDHKTPHHKETISEHTILVAEEIVKWTIHSEDLWQKDRQEKMSVISRLHMTALYHDLGKYWTGQYDESVGHYRYPGHENVSAMIFVTEALLRPEKLTFVNWYETSKYKVTDSNTDNTLCTFKTPQEVFIRVVTQVILNHMIAKTRDFTPKAIKRRQLTQDELWLLDVFTQLDNKGRS